MEPSKFARHRGDGDITRWYNQIGSTPADKIIKNWMSRESFVKALEKRDKMPTSAINLEDHPNFLDDLHGFFVAWNVHGSAPGSYLQHLAQQKGMDLSLAIAEAHQLLIVFGVPPAFKFEV